MAQTRSATTTAPEPIPAIGGGFLPVDVAQLHRAWQLCRTRAGGSTDFRAWLAALEMKARRGGQGRGHSRASNSRDQGQRRPTFGVAELGRLCAIGERRAATAIRNLAQLGLLNWDAAGHSITFPMPPPAPGQPDETTRKTLLDDSLPSSSGVAALPRRMVRFLAHGARPALIATALGVILRCVSRRRAGWTARGRVKASWIAEVFGVDARRVKAARADLVQLGWLRTDEGIDPQWAWNRWGRAFIVDLAWVAPVRLSTTEAPQKSASQPPRETATSAPTLALLPGADRHPSPPSVDLELPPPDLHLDPVPEKKNPDLGSAQPDGDDLDPRKDQADSGTSPPPRFPQTSSSEKSVGFASRRASQSSGLNRIEAADLSDLDRTLSLYAAAIRAGWLGEAEVDRLRFVAAAIHARTVGTTNPPGLFRAIVEGKRWHLLTQTDEDQARTGLRCRDRIGAMSPTTRHHPTLCERSTATATNPLGALMDRFAPRLAALGAIGTTEPLKPAITRRVP